MSKEINLFEKEIESVTKPVPQGTHPSQLTFPGVIEQLHATQDKQKKDSQIRFHVKRIIEALLFASSEPLGFNKIREIIEQYHSLKPRELRQLIEELQHDYLTQQRAFRLEEIAKGFILHSSEEYSRYIEQLYRNKRTEKLSQASAEVLAIIAYRQPVTKPQIEAIRGVDSTGIIQNLLERRLIEPVGRLEAPGRPTLYSITRDFLTHFGLRDLADLPNFEKKKI